MWLIIHPCCKAVSDENSYKGLKPPLLRETAEAFDACMPYVVKRKGPIPVYLPRDVVLHVEPSTLEKPPPSFPHLARCQLGSFTVRRRLHWVPWWQQVSPPRCLSALTFGVANCVSMLLQTQNITHVPTGVHVGFVVVLLLPEKVRPFDPLEISLNRFLFWRLRRLKNRKLSMWRFLWPSLVVYSPKNLDRTLSPPTSTYFRSPTLK